MPPRRAAGYSGTAVYSRAAPLAVSTGFQLPSTFGAAGSSAAAGGAAAAASACAATGGDGAVADSAIVDDEGRVQTAVFDAFIIVNV